MERRLSRGTVNVRLSGHKIELCAEARLFDSVPLSYDEAVEIAYDLLAAATKLLRREMREISEHE